MLYIVLQMEFAIKVCCGVALYVLYLLQIVNTEKICKVPNGDTGTCELISNCQPLLDLYKKKFKAPHEDTYIQQSFCGRPGVPKLKVCCPSKSLWSKFNAEPVTYSTLMTSNPVTKKVTESVPTFSIPVAINEILDTRIYPEDRENENCGIDTASSNKIIGGTMVQIDQYPWLALLEYAGEKLACGGSLISRKFVLTAAHCLSSQIDPPLKVRLSEFNTSSTPTDYVEVDGGGYDNITVTIVPVKKVYVNPKYDRFQKIHDIGLVEMETKVEFSDFIKIICLPNRNFVPDFKLSTNFSIAGWGSTNFSKESEVKLELAIPYVPWDRCEKVQNADIMDTQICAGGNDGEDSCDGDSGGPLMYEYNEKYYAVGIISYGFRECGRSGKPATHTNVYKYISWINKIMYGKN